METFYQKTDWQNSPSTNSPINETNLNNIEDGIAELDKRVCDIDANKSNVDWVQLEQSGKKIAEITVDGVKKNVYAPNGSGGEGGSSVEWNQIQTEGKKIAEVTIDGDKKEVFAPEGGSGSVTEYGTSAEFEAEKDSFPVGTEYLVTDDYDSDSGFDYSEEEICVGTYMGKKRYVKICPVTRTTATSANTWNAVASAPANVERVIHIEFLRVNDALGTIVSQYSRIYNGNIELYNTFTIGATAMTNAHVLIEYTKVGD